MKQTVTAVMMFADNALPKSAPMVMIQATKPRKHVVTAVRVGRFKRVALAVMMSVPNVNVRLQLHVLGIRATKVREIFQSFVVMGSMPNVPTLAVRRSTFRKMRLAVINA